jgi:hypothetical protein
MLNILKVMYDCTFIHTHWAPSSKSLLKKLPIYMCPMFIHVELIVNYELIENDLKFNWELIINELEVNLRIITNKIKIIKS